MKASALALLLLLAAAPAPAAVVDDFGDAARWTALPASGVAMRLDTGAGVAGRALRVDFAFEKGGGYAVLRREVDLRLPDNYRFTLQVRGETGPQNFELKLVDSTGANVWWSNRRDFAFPVEWTPVHTKRRHVSFAWGPAGGGELRRVRAIEIAITAGSGGRGTVWLDELTLDSLPPDPPEPPRPVASAFSSERRRPAAHAVDGDSATLWRSGATPPRPWLEVHLGMDREFSGLVIDWAPGAHPPSYVVEASLDGRNWRVLRRVTEGDGGRDWLHLPETEARRLRIRALRPGPIAIREVAVMPLDWAPDRTSFLRRVAEGSPRGHWPRSLAGGLGYWTVAGTPRGHDEILLGEDGAVETGAGRFSIEPFLHADGRLLSWADAAITPGLEAGRLPLPLTRWSVAGLELEVRVAVSGDDAGSAWLRYVVRNGADTLRRVTLALALRPLQVNPPSQALNLAGGAARLDTLAADSVLVTAGHGRALAALTPWSGFGAVSFDGGGIVPWLARGVLPPARPVFDAEGLASGALAFVLDVPERSEAEVVLLVPLGPLDGTGLARLRDAALALRGAGPARAARSAAAAAARAHGEAAGLWRGLASRAGIELPDREIADTFAAQIGWILVNRDGPAIQPGSRSYARSWIRDGALTSSALLRVGHADAAREFLEWFAPFQYDDGKVPCCVDRRGSDPVPEHDSHGQLIWLAAENHRLTRDRAALERVWRNVRAAALHLDSLRGLRRTPEYQSGESLKYFGLLPPSISHEGYSAKPMHSYWDDLFALRGLRDAAYVAATLGHAADAARFEHSAAEFAADFGASVRRAMADHGIDYVPGAADLGDFDATSTTIALSPVQAGEVLPGAAVERTFERYWEFFVRRRDGAEPWDAFTPYEIRNVGAFVRLGWRERAHELLDWFMGQRQPPEWRQWPEVVLRERRTPRFLGDLPHTWVGSDFLRAVLEMLAYERESDGALVVAAGVAGAWLEPGADPIRVRHVATRWGPVSYTLRRDGGRIELRMEPGLDLPPGGIVVAAPGVEKGWRARVDGRGATVTAAGEVVVRKAAFTLELEPPR